MKNRSYLSYLFAALIALQSFAAVGDSFSFLLVDTQSPSFNSLSSTGNVEPFIMDFESDSEIGCELGCQCLCPCNLYLSVVNPLPDACRYMQHESTYSGVTLESPVITPFRPPIV